MLPNTERDVAEAANDAEAEADVAGLVEGEEEEEEVVVVEVGNGSNGGCGGAAMNVAIAHNAAVRTSGIGSLSSVRSLSGTCRQWKEKAGKDRKKRE
jgi:hypothetical protein